MYFSKCGLLNWQDNCAVSTQVSAKVTSQLFTYLRDGPLEIAGVGGGKKFSVQELFLRPTCLQEFFFWDTSFARIFLSPTDTYLFFLQHI